MSLGAYRAIRLQGSDIASLELRLDHVRSGIRRMGGTIVDIRWDERNGGNPRHAVVLYHLKSPLRRPRDRPVRPVLRHR